MKLPLLTKVFSFLVLLLYFNCTDDIEKPKYINIFDPTSDFDDNPPTASITVTPDSGIANETEFTFDASGSKEEEMPDAQLYYRWDFDNNGIWDTPESTEPKIDHIFTLGGGKRLVRALVKGAKGLTSTDTINIYVNSRPNIILNWQTDFENSNLIHFDASNSSDYEDGDNLEYRWDFNNDGSWEYSWSDSSEISFEFSTDEWEVKLEGRDTQHLISERIISGNLPNDAIAYYPFNGNANDESGNGNHGTVYGASLTEDRFGTPNSAYNFDGTDDYIDLGNSSSLKPNFPISISIWVKPISFEHTIGLFRNNIDDTRYFGIFCHITNGSALCVYGNGGRIGPDSRKTKVGESVLNLNQWYHLVFLYKDASNMEIYINGKNDGGIYGGNATSMEYNQNSCEIGTHDSQQYEPPLYATAMIDNIYLFDRILTEEEILALYNDKN